MSQIIKAVFLGITLFFLNFSWSSSLSADAIQIIDQYDNGWNDRGIYQDRILGVAEPTDCSGFAIRACIILRAAGIDCQIAVENNHAFIYVPGEGFIEPQLGALLPFRPVRPVTYTLEQYIATFPGASNCVIPAPAIVRQAQ